LCGFLAIRSGDYYMFEDYGEDEELEMIDSIAEEEDEDEDELRPTGLTVSEVRIYILPICTYCSITFIRWIFHYLSWFIQ